ncbi:MAG: DUF424 family protein [Methanomassiliicoccaceae archaeon]|nr:DUF424 family protein [Methanomassiliicoccaceae archaeon]
MHVRGTERLLAACDEELLGMTFREGNACLKVSEHFYKGELVTEEAFRERMRSVTIMNLVGDRTVREAISCGHVSESATMIIGGVRHAQAAVM